MQSSLIACVVVLASCASAAHFRQEHQQPAQVPVPVPVTDLMVNQPQAATDQQQATQGPPTLTAAVQPTPGGAIVPGQAAVAPHLAQIAAQVVSQAAAKNVTKIAFGQITDLGSEFHQLREDDQAHVKQLGVDIHLREHLEQQLHAAEERLENDNAELAQETGSIVAAPSPDAVSSQNSSEPAPPALVQAKSTSTKVVSDQIGMATAQDVKTLDADITSLHARDVNEVKALRGNAETRSALSAQIAKEREELMANSETLAANLGQIRELVAPSSTAAVPSPSPADVSASAASAASEALVQQDAPPTAQEDTNAPTAQENAQVAAATVAPEAGTEGTWLR